MNPAPNAIVILDDEKSYTDLMSQLLADNLDCPVHGFTRPFDALAAIPGIGPRVIITDYFMPQIDGMEFIRQAAPLAPTASFILISGHNLGAHEEELATLTGLRGFLAKPFGWRKLADEIVRVWPRDAPAPSHRADATSL